MALSVFRSGFLGIILAALIACGGKGVPDAGSSSGISNSSGSSSSSSSGSSSSSSSSSSTSSASSSGNTVLLPAPGATNINPDTRLTLTFDGVPRLGSGRVSLYDADSGALVDQINIPDDVDFLGYAGQSRLRRVNVKPAVVDGRTLTISPHSSVLSYGKSYLVTIDASVVQGDLAGVPFRGVDKNDLWLFTTKATPPSQARVSVDDDGNADFSTVQGALNYVMQNPATTSAAQVDIRNGRYRELLFLRNKHNVRLVGESRDGVVIEYDNFDAFNAGSGGSGTRNEEKSGGRSVFLIEGSDLLSLENLTLFNTHRRSFNGSAGAQAETLYFNHATGRLIAKNAAFISEQDTLLLKGYSWFYRSLVAGNVDFIWGYSKAALFEESEIRSLGDSKNPGSDAGGYILQARVESAEHPGFVFLNSRFTRGPGPAGNTVGNGKTYLARSGNSAGAASYFDSMALINCRLDSHIAASGWFDESAKGKVLNPLPGSARSGLREIGSRDPAGTPLNLSQRYGTYPLTSQEVNHFYANRALIFSGFADGAGWNPQP